MQWRATTTSPHPSTPTRNEQESHQTQLIGQQMRLPCLPPKTRPVPPSHGGRNHTRSPNKTIAQQDESRRIGNARNTNRDPSPTTHHITCHTCHNNRQPLRLAKWALPLPPPTTRWNARCTTNTLAPHPHALPQITDSKKAKDQLRSRKA